MRYVLGIVYSTLGQTLIKTCLKVQNIAIVIAILDTTLETLKTMRCTSAAFCTCIVPVSNDLFEPK
jgi:hypothetical protein